MTETDITSSVGSPLSGGEASEKSRYLGPVRTQTALNSIWRRLSQFFGLGDPLRGRSSRQYMLALESTYLALPENEEVPEDRVPTERLRYQIERILSDYIEANADWRSPTVWDDAYRCERLIIELIDASRLDVELDRRILEMEKHDKSLSDFYGSRKKSISDADPDVAAALPKETQLIRKRALLARVTRDLQWHYNMLDLKRRYAHHAQLRVSTTFLVALATFGLVILTAFQLQTVPGKDLGTQAAGIAPNAQINAGEDQ